MGNTSSLPSLGTGITLSMNTRNVTKIEADMKDMDLSPIYWSIISAAGVLAIFSLYKIIKLLRDRNR